MYILSPRKQNIIDANRALYKANKSHGTSILAMEPHIAAPNNAIKTGTYIKMNLLINFPQKISCKRKAVMIIHIPLHLIHDHQQLTVL